MNQCMRERFYCNGNARHIDYIIKEGGMSEDEAMLFRLLHDNADDSRVEDEMCIDRKHRMSLETMVSRKAAVAILHAIDAAIAAE